MSMVHSHQSDLRGEKKTSRRFKVIPKKLNKIQGSFKNIRGEEKFEGFSRSFKKRERILVLPLIL